MLYGLNILPTWIAHSARMMPLPLPEHWVTSVARTETAYRISHINPDAGRDAFYLRDKQEVATSAAARLLTG